MKKVITLILCLGLVFCFIGCGADNEEEPAVPDTMGTKLLADFKAELENTDDINAIAESLSGKDYIEFKSMVVPCEEGYLAGFDAEISGFNSCICFSPVIGTIPFVCYIFQSDDAEALKDTLVEHADPCWNICTEAEETVYEVVDGYVFFVMCPGEEAE